MFEGPELFRENVAYFDRPATKICFWNREVFFLFGVIYDGEI